MFEAHFGLRENPFSTSHDSRFVYPSPEHLEAVAHFRYGMQNREAFVLVTGEVGTGKTTAVQDLVSRLPQQAQVALIQNTALSRPELMEEIARRFSVELEPGMSKPALMSRLESALRTRCERGEFGLLVVDEAQNLSSEMLEEIRLLSNFELGPGRHFLICLVGQPELEERLARPDLRQLRQRIGVKYRLKPLDDLECIRYIHHRIRVAGGDGERVFPVEAVRAVHAVTHGIPREINIVAGQAMLNAYVDGSPVVRSEHVHQVVEEFAFRSVVREVPASTPPPTPEPPRPAVAPQRPSSPRETQPIAPVSPVERPPRQPLSTSFPSPARPASPEAPPPPVQPPMTPPPAAETQRVPRQPAEPPASAHPAPEPQPVATSKATPPPAAPPRPAPVTESSPTLTAPPARGISDWESPEEAPGVIDTVKRAGKRRVPAPVLIFVLVAVVAASVMLTGIGRELWGVFFPPEEPIARLEENRISEPTPPTPYPETPVENPAPATGEGPEDALAGRDASAGEGAAGTSANQEARTSDSVSEVEAPNARTGAWVIQAASFRSESGAQRALGIMVTASGLSGRVVPGTGDSEGWYRVLLGSFPTRRAANVKTVELLDAGLIPEDSYPARNVP